MAGDWLKIEAATPDKPEVFEIAVRCKITPADAFGRLFLVWRWFDQHTEKGNAPSVTQAYLDHLVGLVGFADAMRNVGWLDGGNDGHVGVKLPNFARHNGKTAKTRALTAKRVAAHKQRPPNAAVTRPALPREEKRREEPKQAALPLSFPAGISEQDWQAFRDHRNKQRKPMTAKAEHLALAKLHDLVRQGYDATRTLNHAIEAGWLTFFPRDDCRAGGGGAVTRDIGKCECGAAATMKVGNKPRCGAHARGYPVAA